MTLRTPINESARTRVQDATQIAHALCSDTGRVRDHNEDFCAADAELGVFVVCDGMGGAAAGEVASRIAAEAFLQTLRQGVLYPEATPQQRLVEAVASANRAVYKEAKDQPALRGMGTTLVAILMQPGGGEDENVVVAHVGDSRCYRLRGSELMALTVDHSLVADQVEMGEITLEEAAVSPMRNVILRAIGTHAKVEAEVAEHSAMAGDLFLLCSDGLTRDLKDEELCALLLEHGHDLDTAAKALVEEANRRGGGDNITCLLVRRS